MARKDPNKRKAKDRKKDKRSKDRLRERNKVKPSKLKSIIGGLKDKARSLLGRLRRPAATPEPGTWLMGPYAATGSSWVESFGFLYVDSTIGMGLAIKFLDQFQCVYPSTTMDDCKSMLHAKSRGTWVWENVYTVPYIEL